MDDGDEHGVSLPTFEMLDPAPVGIAITRGPDHHLLYANPRYRDLFGDLPLGVPLREAFAGLADKDRLQQFDKVIAGESPIVRTNMPGDPTMVTPAGQRRIFTSSLSRITFPDGVPGVLVMALEVTDEINAAQRIPRLLDQYRRVLRRYESLIQVSGQILWVTDPEGNVVERSPEWERVTGQTWEEFRGGDWLRAVHPDDRAALEESWSRALRQTPDTWEHIYRLRTANGEYRHFQDRAVAIREDGRVVEWVGTCTDIEDRWQRRRRRRLVERATEAMTSGESLEEMLGELTRIIVPELADGCTVHLVTDLAQGMGGGPSLVVERVAAAVAPGLPPMPVIGAQRLAQQSGFVEAVRHGRPVVRTFPPGSPPDELAPSGKQEWLRASRANSVAVLPVSINGTVIAVIMAATCGRRPPLEQHGLDLLRGTFEQAHDALRNAMRFQQARRIAFAMQHSLLAEPPKVPGLDIVARYRPSFAAAEVGGDWYDSFILPDGTTAVVIGDVAGHDLRAAVAMGRIRNMLRGLIVDRDEPPGDVLARLSRATTTLYIEETATCALAKVERHDGGADLHYSLAGHPPPLLVTEDGECHFLESATNPLLGVPCPQPFVSAREPLPPHSTVLFYTDGLLERPDEDLGEGLARLCDQAGAQARAPLSDLCDDLLDSMPMSQADDIAMIAIRFTGTDTPDTDGQAADRPKSRAAE